MDKTIAHLGFIQAIVARMGANSFLLKSWSVALVVALFALAVKDADKRFMILAYFPIIAFWALDGFFLTQEKLYRKLYEEVAEGRQPSDKFSLDTTGVKGSVKNIFCQIFSKTLLLFHGIIFLTVLFSIFFLSTGK